MKLRRNERARVEDIRTDCRKVLASDLAMQAQAPTLHAMLRKVAAEQKIQLPDDLATACLYLIRLIDKYDDARERV